MKLRHLCTLLLLMLSTTLLAQSKKSTRKSQTSPPATEQQSIVSEKTILESFDEYTYESFMRMYANGIDEKIYVQTDKPYYSAGDKIWFKAYVRNAITNAPSKLSKFVYVELINKRDSLIQRVKIKADTFGFHNCLTIAPKTTQGEYTLRAYTQWMRNNDDKFFFYKKLKIVNPIDDAVTIAVNYKTLPDKEIETTMELRDQNNNLITNSRVSYTLSIDNKTRQYNSKTSDKGILTFNFAAPTSHNAGNIIRISSTDDDRTFAKTLFLPSFDDQFDVQFFPEGGDWIQGHYQTIAFKAIGTDGLARDIKGKVFASTGEEIGDMESTHLGMGVIKLMAQPNTTYYATITDIKSGKTQRFNLPQPKASGCTIQAVQSRGKLLYQIFATPDVNASQLGVIVHSRGKIISAHKLDSPGAKLIEDKFMTPGIGQISIVDINTATTLSQRLFFVLKPHIAAQIHANKSRYARRETATLTINVKDENGTPAEGEFAIAVTDRSSVTLDSLEDNIVSYILLSSDIRGYVEQPRSYFDCSPLESVQRLDNLMLTQGWTRFNVDEVMKRQFSRKTYQPEAEQTFSGNVKGFFGNDARNASLLIFNSTTRFFDKFPLERSRFSVAVADYPDNTPLVIQAIGKSGNGNTLLLDIEDQTFPDPTSLLTASRIENHKLSVPETFMTQSKQRYYYEGGMRVIDMEEVTVTTQRPKQRPTMYNMAPTRSMSQTMLESFAHSTVLNALSSFPSVLTSPEGITVRGSSGMPLFYVNEIPVSFDEISMMSMDEVAAIDMVVGPEAAIFGLGAGNGVFLIALKDGSELRANSKPLPSFARIVRLGYKTPAEFYVPKYDQPKELNDSKPDLRTTIYWNPTIVTDSTGTAKVTFYTADKPTTYDISLEGITNNGEIVHTQSSIVRE